MTPGQIQKLNFPWRVEWRIYILNTASLSLSFYLLLPHSNSRISLFSHSHLFYYAVRNRNMVLIPNKKVFQIFLSLPRPLTRWWWCVCVSVIKFFSPAVPRSHAPLLWMCVYICAKCEKSEGGGGGVALLRSFSLCHHSFLCNNNERVPFVARPTCRVLLKK